MKMLFTATVLAAFAGQAFSQPPSPASNAFLDQRLADQIGAAVRDRAALDAYLRNLPPNSPLLAMPAQQRQRFLDSLVFSERGLASYSYVPLQQIDVADAYRILSLFGVQSSLRVVPGTRANSKDGEILQSLMVTPRFSPHVDYPNYACRSRATCSGAYDSVCIGSNC